MFDAFISHDFHMFDTFISQWFHMFDTFISHHFHMFDTFIAYYFHIDFTFSLMLVLLCHILFNCCLGSISGLLNTIDITTLSDAIFVYAGSALVNPRLRL